MRMHIAWFRADSDGRTGPQTGDLVTVVPDLAENLVGVLAEQRRTASDGARRGRNPERRLDDRDVTGRTRERHPPQIPHGGHMRVVEHVLMNMVAPSVTACLLAV